ncbi:MAG TPA: tRNA 4-thiouridine(8) synthase ThiI [Firmicutes bacterium]|nr:tRNA 4-thiouridine(8) synthase ThiI [Bacillota bacterium]
MREILLIKNGELALKGLNRSTFEDTLIRHIRRSLKPLGEVKIRKAQSTIYIEPQSEFFDYDEAADRISRIFGIAAFSRAAVAEKDMESILAVAEEFLAPRLREIATFKVEAKRADKRFPVQSPEICREVGGRLLSRFPHLQVDVHNPDEVVVVEVRDFGAYIHCGQQPGAGGMPVGTAGKASILISGGIDSPVAAWMMAKRGINLDAVHFASPPYTSPRAEQKVIDLLRQVAKYSGPIRLEIVPFTEIQEQIGEHCPEEYFTLIMRRFMMEIAEGLARRSGSLALITGESVGQVASQTLKALCVTDEMVHMPVFRPLIGMDKSEIIGISRKIETFEISTLPYEDCCTVFTPKHPRTRPDAERVRQAEAALDRQALIEKAISGVRALLVE